MKFYDVKESINASPETIWKILTDGPGLTTWESGVVRFDGTVAPGSKFKIYSEISPERGFATKVSTLDAPHKMVWEGGMPLGLFKGVRTFTLTPDGSSTTFHMREEFTGLLLGMIWKTMPDLGPTFTKFAQGLKTQAEAATNGGS